MRIPKGLKSAQLRAHRAGRDRQECPIVNVWNVIDRTKSIPAVIRHHAKASTLPARLPVFGHAAPLKWVVKRVGLQQRRL